MPSSWSWCALALVSVVSCSSPDTRSPARPSAASIEKGATGSAAASSVTSTATASSGASSAAAAPDADKPVVAGPRVTAILFPKGVPDGICKDGASKDKVRCLVARRYEEDPQAKDLAVALFDEVGDVVGLEREYDMEGGFRGTIHLVPELPIGKYRKHLEYVVTAQRTIEKFIVGIREKATSPVRYRHGAIAWRFMRSVGRTTPSAYALDWEVGYNVSGSLHGSQVAVTETVFHEVFHLNDFDHGEWSRKNLGTIVDGIVKKCGTNVGCLKPFAPGKTMVRGGTYYAFQPNNGDIAHEYSAELATRYFLEQTEALAGRPVKEPFKCGPDENAQAWKKMVDEFFGGADAVKCP